MQLFLKKSDIKGVMFEMLLYLFVKGSKVDKFIIKGFIIEFMLFLFRLIVIFVIIMIKVLF